jgi:dTDP-4-amino-4,6-dideoxygalactose transaminase
MAAAAPPPEALEHPRSRRRAGVSEPPAVPLLDLSRVHRELREALLADIGAVIDSGTFTSGAQVEAFELEFAARCGAAHCVGLASGLDALRIALIALGIGPGDEVVLPALTFVATLEAVVQAGATAVVVDVRADDYGLDVEAAAAAVTERTRALVPVHLYGQMVDMRALRDLAGRNGLTIVEDACQAHLARRDGLRAGACGAAGAFSFYPGKNLGALGDAGALVMSDAGIAAQARALREHGQRRKYHHDMLGYTARLDTIQATVLLRKLARLPEWNRQRTRAAERYNSALAGVGDVRPLPVPAGSEPVWHLYPVRTSFRAELEHFLGARGIGTGRHYPFPIHETAAYRRAGLPSVPCPVAEVLTGELLSLPIFPGITDEELDTVTGMVAAFFRRGWRRPASVRTSSR